MDEFLAFVGREDLRKVKTKSARKPASAAIAAAVAASSGAGAAAASSGSGAASQRRNSKSVLSFALSPNQSRNTVLYSACGRERILL